MRRAANQIDKDDRLVGRPNPGGRLSPQEAGEGEAAKPQGPDPEEATAGQAVRGPCVVRRVSAVPASPRSGAPTPPHGASRKPTRPEPPARDSVSRAEKVRNPIDQFGLRRLEATGLEPAPRAERATLVRRAYF